MKAVGIIAEYNPLHNGHEYHIKKALEGSKAEVLIVAMSGNFVQRGEPAILDKWTRAELAIKSGADIVCEIPTIFAVNNAGYFAKAGTEILDSLKISQLSFGVNIGSAEDLETIGEVASYIKENREELEAEIANTRGSENYAAARQRILEEHLGKSLEGIIDNPNNILAIEYLANTKAASCIPVQRKGTDYHDDFANGGFASASYIRKALAQKNASLTHENSTNDKLLENVEKLVPSATLRALNESKLATINSLFETLRTQVLVRSGEELNSYYGMEEGLGNILKREIRNVSSYAALVEKLKSKRYTYVGIQRAMLMTLLGIKKCDVHEAKNYVRILALSETGAKYLKEIKKAEASNLPIITNINKDLENCPKVRKTLEYDILASDLYNAALGNDLYSNSDYVKHPYIAK